jgi:ferritin
MIKEKMQAELNKQINEELFSSYLYLSMSAYFESQNLSGMAHWMNLQSQEEHQHAMKMYAYLIQKGGRPVLEQIAKPQHTWNGTLDVFEATLTHEQHITARIDHLVDVAISERDHATNGFLQWFVTEQVEEEANVNKIIDELKMVGDNKTGLFMMDRELAQRVLTAPAAE